MLNIVRRRQREVAAVRFITFFPMCPFLRRSLHTFFNDIHVFCLLFHIPLFNLWFTHAHKYKWMDLNPLLYSACSEIQTSLLLLVSPYPPGNYRPLSFSKTKQKKTFTIAFMDTLMTVICQCKLVNLFLLPSWLYKTTLTVVIILSTAVSFCQKLPRRSYCTSSVLSCRLVTAATKSTLTSRP